MTTSAEIMQREKEFWQAMVEQDHKKAASMLTEEAANVSAFGVHHFTPSDYVKMAEEGDAKITEFSFSEEKVIFPAPDVAIATYKVKKHSR